MVKRPLIAGLIAANAQLALFFVLVTTISGWTTARTQFAHYWYFILALALSFGLQVGLYVYLREAIRRAATGRVMAITGTTSTAAMISCCTHYLVNILPFLGTAGIVAFVGQYQVQLFWLGLVGNVAGIAYSSWQIRRFQQHHQPVPVQPLVPPPPSSALGLNHGIVLVAFVIVTVGAWVVAAPKIVPSDAVGAAENKTEGPLGTKTNTDGGMTVAVTPKQGSGGGWEFTVQIDNHSQAVTQDMVAVSSLTTSTGATVQPTAWAGDPPGGHHRRGTLTFESLPAGTTAMTLTLRQLGGIPTRIFTWDNLPSS